MIQLIVFAVCLLFLFMEWILLTFITGERLPSLALMFSYVMGMIISCAHIFKHHEIANSKSNILINIFPILSTLPAFLLASFIDCDYGIWGNIFIAMLFLLRQYEICVFHFCLFCLFACTMGNTEVRKSGFIIGHTRYTFYSLQFCVVSAW